MAKKKINIKSVATDVESGDVNISYKNVRIAGLSESITAVLETEDTICEDDIEVEYTKPETGIPVGNIANFTNNTSNSISVLPFMSTTTIDNTGMTIRAIVISANSSNTSYLISAPYDLDSQHIGLYVESETDQYVITTGSTVWTYDSRERTYLWRASDTNPVNNQTYNVTITNKE